MQKFKIVGVVISIFFVVLILVLLLTEWRPKDIERVEYATKEVYLPDTLRLLSWNIGYAGLGDDMDFFIDGGQQVRTSRSRTVENLVGIISQLKSLEKNIDFILLQEVDISSKRSYFIDESKEIFSALRFDYQAIALNYNSIFVPIPLSEPMGRTKAGVMTLSKYPISQQVRRSYPSTPSFPRRLFDLKRCMLSVAIPISGGDTLWINNTHNSAFLDSNVRYKEIDYISDVINKYPLSLTAGDWNSTPIGYTPTKAAQESKFFSPLTLKEGDLGGENMFAADTSRVSMRYLDSAYDPHTSVTTLVDFAVLGQRCKILECEILDLGFQYSDHNPFIITFVLD